MKRNWELIKFILKVTLLIVFVLSFQGFDFVNKENIVASVVSTESQRNNVVIKTTSQTPEDKNYNKIELELGLASKESETVVETRFFDRTGFTFTPIVEEIGLVEKLEQLAISLTSILELKNLNYSVIANYLAETEELVEQEVLSGSEKIIEETIIIDTLDSAKEEAPPVFLTPKISLRLKENFVEHGGRTTIYWSAQNAKECFASKDWYGDRRVSGEMLLERLLADSTFILTCYNGDKEAQGLISLTVDLPPGRSSGRSPRVLPTPPKKSSLISALASAVVSQNLPSPGQAVSYSIAGAKGVFPRFISADIAPLNVLVGDTQTLTVRVFSSSGIVGVQAETKLDGQTFVLDLVEISSNSRGSTYEAFWVVFDTHTEVYKTTFTALDERGNSNSVTLAWIDPCIGISDGTDSTLASDCAVSITDGIDGGNLIIPQGTTLTLNPGALFAWNPGKSIKINGSIAIAKGSSLQKGYLFFEDLDGDKYAGKIEKVFSKESTKPNHTRQFEKKNRKINNINPNELDNDDSNGSCWQLGYLDSDGDGYGAGEIICIGDESGYIDNSDDCNDNNKNKWEKDPNDSKKCL